VSGRTFSPLERTVLQRVASGLTRHQIAVETGYSVDGVQKVIRRAYRKLGAINPPHAILLACRAGLLDGTPQQRHGDHAGFRAHERRDEDPCDACWAGENDYRAEMRRKRRQKAGATTAQPETAPRRPLDARLSA
jgi:DNA-binding CsgD family transcriptional regulator